ncbi:MAG: hypothetical protein WCK90_01660 [archaeon]
MINTAQNNRARKEIPTASYRIEDEAERVRRCEFRYGYLGEFDLKGMGERIIQKIVQEARDIEMHQRRY